MRKMLAAASLAATVSLATIAWAQTKPLDQPMPQPYLAMEQAAPPIQDARALANDREVGQRVAHTEMRARNIKPPSIAIASPQAWLRL